MMKLYTYDCGREGGLAVIAATREDARRIMVLHQPDRSLDGAEVEYVPPPRDEHLHEHDITDGLAVRFRGE